VTSKFTIILILLHFVTGLAIAFSYVDSVHSVWKKIPMTIVMPLYLGALSYIVPLAILTMVTEEYN